ncbi:MAG: tetratricopeptide repeat protein, partial [Anaerolineales bacterium]|nr:tetratricopeptide repeat protein [Anaerolineales bacterium]
MAETPLRAYIRDIDSMIDRGDLEDAIIHCRHILGIYPKHIDTYRLLGKAFLEAQRYSDAADVFQRVLSSVPDDYISHIGMSLIREDEANIEAAISHMERAAEVQPANQAIQAEQRRLYGRRDRVEPSRVGLTRGALARMYYNGELYSQAITELRAALAEEPQRSDLRLLLANTYYKSGREVDAADACSSILSKLPYCFEANLLLAEILSHTKRAEESKIYSQRAYELDPYAEYITENTSSSTMVPESSVMVEHLDDESEQDQELSQADWITSIGLQDDDLKQKPSLTPEWLLDESSDQLPDNGDLESSKDHIPPFTFLEDDEDVEPAKTVPPTDYGDVTPEISDNDTMMDQAQDTDELLPDWLKDAGWHSTVDGEDAQEIEASTELETTTLPEISEADIPDWLQALAPPEDVEADQKTETQLTTGEIGEAAARSWLDSSPAAATEGDKDWLGLKGETESDLDSALSQDEIEAPEWLKNLTPSSDMSKEEIPDWLVDLEEAISEDTDTDKEAITESSERSAPDDSSAADEISDAPSAESIIDDALIVTAVGIAAADQLSQPEPEDDPEGLLTSDQDPLDTPQEGDYQAYVEDAPEIPALELSEQLEEEISEQLVPAQESGDDTLPIDNGEDLPKQEDRAEIEPVETVVGPLEGIAEDATTEELLEEIGDDLLQTTHELLKLDVEETVESYPDSSIEKT